MYHQTISEAVQAVVFSQAFGGGSLGVRESRWMPSICHIVLL
jgi:hypothetical protein